MSPRHITSTVKFITLALCLSASLLFCNSVLAAENTPQVIPEDQSCGKCGMFPARYPQWQSQIVFTDGTMTPFDGCKCMFGFMHNMKEYDSDHNMPDIANIWVRDFNTGEWFDAKTAHFVIGSDVMGPMGKELIPFREQQAAESFHKEHGGHMADFAAVNMETLKPLMGKMHMKGKMDMHGDMKGKMDMHHVDLKK